MQINKQDIEVLTNLMLEYSKENGFPFYEKIKEHNEIYKSIFSGLNMEDYYSNLLKDYILKKVESTENTKMGKLFKECYTNNNRLFTKFVILNLKKEFNNEFNEIGEQVKEKLILIEEELFKSIERSQFKDFSTGLYKKYDFMIKSIFPYINNVGVTIRKA